MFRWLNGGSGTAVAQVKRPTTDDPLATLDKRSGQLYTVSRSNPLFSDPARTDYDTSGYQSQRSNQSNSNSLHHSCRNTCDASEWRHLAPKLPLTRTGHMIAEGNSDLSGLDVAADASIVEYTTVPPRPVWPPASRSGRSGGANSLTVHEGVAASLHHRPASAHGHHAQENSVLQRPLVRPRSVDFDLNEEVGAGQQKHYCRSIVRNPQLSQSAAPDSIVTDSLLVLMTPVAETSRGRSDPSVNTTRVPAAISVKSTVPVTDSRMLRSIYHQDSLQPTLPTTYGPDSIVTDSLLVLTRPREQVELQTNLTGTCSTGKSIPNPATNVVTVGTSSTDSHKTLFSVNSQKLEEKSDVITRISDSSSRITTNPPPQSKSVRSSVSSDIGSVTSLLSAGSASTLIRRDPNVSTDPVAFVMRLWERTGLRTNGRKLLVGDPDRIYSTSQVSPGGHSSASDSQESDTSSSRSDSGGHRRPLSLPRLPISQGWLERISVTSDELSATATANLHRNRHYNQPSSTNSSTAYLNQVIPPVAPSDGSHEYQSVVCRQSSGSDGSESSGERRVTFSADTVDNENNSGRMRRLYECHRTLHAVPPPLPPPARPGSKCPPVRAPAPPPRSSSITPDRELTLSAADLRRSGTSKSENGVVFRPIDETSRGIASSATNICEDLDKTWPMIGASRGKNPIPTPSSAGPDREAMDRERFRIRDEKRLGSGANTCRCLWVLTLLGAGLALFVGVLIIFQWLMDPDNQSHHLPQPPPLEDSRLTTASVRQLSDLIS